MNAWHAVLLGLSLPFTVLGCAGTLTDEQIAALVGETVTPVGSTTDCGFTLLTKVCGAGQDTFSKCKSCSGFSSCHGKDTPAVVGLDLTAEGLGDGSKYVNHKADDSAMGSCGAGALTPATGKVYIDPTSPEKSLLYQKVTVSYGCGLRMPFPGTTPLSDTDQQCILSWIKSVPGVARAGADAAGDH